MTDLLVCREHQFALGRDQSGTPYLSMPGSNAQRRVDYEGFFRLAEDELDRFLTDRDAAIGFVARCRRGEMRDRRTDPTDADWEPSG